MGIVPQALQRLALHVAVAIADIGHIHIHHHPASHYEEAAWGEVVPVEHSVIVEGRDGHEQTHLYRIHFLRSSR